MTISISRPRFTIGRMMIGVAVAALAFASLPYLVIDPVTALVVATTGSAIPAVALRGRHKPTLIVALSMAALLTVAVAVREGRSMRRNAALYPRIIRAHANRRLIIESNLKTMDWRAPYLKGTALEEYKQRRALLATFSEYDARTIARYERAASRPWERVEPEPEPSPGSGSDPLLLIEKFW